MKIPRGVQPVQWRNKDGSKSIRYRVRIVRKDIREDQLFETLEEAVEFLGNTKTMAGREAITAGREAASERERAISAMLLSPPMSHYFKTYRERYVGDPGLETDPLKKRGKKSAYSRWASIESCVVGYTPSKLKGLTGILATSSALPRKPLGELLAVEFTPAVADEFIAERLKTVKPSTIQREINDLRAFFNRLHRIDAEAARVVGNNPFTLYDKFLLKKAMEEFDGSRDVRMVDFGDDAESRLFDSLRACENPAMLQIVGLALETGMRRSEILSLRWAQIKDSHVELKRTKTKARKVALSPAAKAILESVKKDGEKLFGYTLDGFASNWKRSRKRAGLDGFRFHDLRREFISRILEGLADPSSAAVCYAAGMSDPKHVENAYIKPAEVRKSLKNGIASQRDLMRTIGHETARTTFRYAALRKK